MCQSSSAKDECDVSDVYEGLSDVSASHEDD